MKPNWLTRFLLECDETWQEADRRIGKLFANPHPTEPTEPPHVQEYTNSRLELPSSYDLYSRPALIPYLTPPVPFRQRIHYEEPIACAVCGKKDHSVWNQEAQHFTAAGWTYIYPKWFCPEHKPPESGKESEGEHH